MQVCSCIRSDDEGLRGGGGDPGREGAIALLLGQEIDARAKEIRLGGAHTRSQAQTSSVETGWAPHRVLQLAALVGEVPQAARINNEPPPLPHLRGWEEGRVVVLAQKQ